MRDGTSVVGVVVEEPSISVNVDMQRIRQLCRDRLPHPAKLECTCAAVLLCDGKIQVSILCYLALVYNSVCTQYWDCTVS